MTPEQFVYWLQGFFEITEVDNEVNTVYLTEEQVKVIRDHLQKVFDQPAKQTKIKTTTQYPFPVQPMVMPPIDTYEDMSPLISWNSTDYPVSC